MLSQEVTHEYSVIAFFHPLPGILLHLRSHSEGPYQFFLPDGKMRPVVVQHQYGGEGSLSVRNQQICRDAVPGREGEFYFPGSISLPLL